MGRSCVHDLARDVGLLLFPNRTERTDGESAPKAQRTLPEKGHARRPFAPFDGRDSFLAGLFCLPFITDILLRRYATHGNPMEIQVPLAIRNLMFGLLVLPRSATGRLAMFTSFFLAIFSALISASTTTNVLFAVYALLGLWWLMGDYWQRIRAHFPDETTTEIPYFPERVQSVWFYFVSPAARLRFNRMR